MYRIGLTVLGACIYFLCGPLFGQGLTATQRPSHPQPGPGFAQVPYDDAAVSPAVVPGWWGNVTDTDTVANSTDALAILSNDIQLPLPPGFAFLLSLGFGNVTGPVNGDTITNSTDALIILTEDAGIPTNFPVGQPVSLPLRPLAPHVAVKLLPSAAGVATIAVHAHSQRRRIMTGEQIEVPLVVDLQSIDAALGSYTAEIRWDPEEALLVDVNGGRAPAFSQTFFNRSAADRGILRLTQANPAGARKQVHIAQLTFESRRGFFTGFHPQVTFTAMAAAGQFTDLLPLLDRQQPSGNMLPVSPIAPLQLAISPNPFNPATRINFTLTAAARVRMEIYNMLGQRVRQLDDRRYPAGTHDVQWRGDTDQGVSLPSGTYVLRMTLVSGQDGRQRPLSIDRKLLLVK